MEKQISAVDFLETIFDNGFQLYKEDFEKAKELFKQQIEDAFEFGECQSDTRFPNYLDGEEYFNETFK